VTRSLIPPRGVFVPARVLFDLTLKPPVRDTVAQLLALAWGKNETPPLSFEQLHEITGKSIPTLYGHLRLLKLRGALRWRSVGSSTFIFSLCLDSAPEDTEVVNSKELELPVNDPSSIKSSDVKINTSDSEILENKNPPKATTMSIKNKYCQLLGYIPHNWAEGEGAAAKHIAEHYTVDDFEKVYLYMKSQRFWQDKHLMLRNIKNQIQGVLAFLSKNGNGQKLSPAQQAVHLSRQHDAERKGKAGQDV